MNIVLIGYGKMGKAIEFVAGKKGHQITHRIDTFDDLKQIKNEFADVAIEFTQPDSAYKNICAVLEKCIPVISGTTGWLNEYEKIAALTDKLGGTFLHSSNFSIGVNLFFELNSWLAKRINRLDFIPSIEEIHHTEKKDSPSGTAVQLAEGILSHSFAKEWVNEATHDQGKLSIISKRKSNVSGIHTVTYHSDLEFIEIKHQANDRSVFAEGALRVAEWIKDQKGVFTMSDFLNHQ